MDNNANNYMLLQQRNIRIPLLAKNGTWKFTINKEKWEIPNCMECLYAYHLIGNQDYKATSATLHANYKHITPIQIEAFIQHFEKTHPVEEYPFNINEIPVYATEKVPLEVPTVQSYRILLTPKQEQEILDLMKNEDNPNRRKEVRQWFRKYTERYALKPRNPYQTLSHYDALGDVFCEIHGVNTNFLYDAERIKQQYELERKLSAEKRKAEYNLGWFIIDVLESPLGWVIGAIVAFLFFELLSWSLWGDEAWKSMWKFVLG